MRATGPRFESPRVSCYFFFRETLGSAAKGVLFGSVCFTQEHLICPSVANLRSSFGLALLKAARLEEPCPLGLQTSCFEAILALIVNLLVSIEEGRRQGIARLRSLTPVPARWRSLKSLGRRSKPFIDKGCVQSYTEENRPIKTLYVSRGYLETVQKILQDDVY